MNGISRSMTRAKPKLLQWKSKFVRQSYNALEARQMALHKNKTDGAKLQKVYWACVNKSMLALERESMMSPGSEIGVWQRV
jgi:hypothetical protein